MGSLLEYLQWFKAGRLPGPPWIDRVTCSADFVLLLDHIYLATN